MRLLAWVRPVTESLGFLVARVAVGLWAYAVLLLGLLVVAALAGAMGVFVVFVAPFLLGAVAAVLLLATVISRFSPAVDAWLESRPVRRRLTQVGRPLGNILAGVGAWWMLTWRAIARRERARIGAFRRDEIDVAYRPLPEGSPATLRVLLADPASWRDLVYLAVEPVVVSLAWLGLGAASGGAIALLATPSPDVPPWAAITAGITLLALLPVASVLAARVAATLGAALLATGETARMRAELDEQRLRRQLAVDAAERERRRIERDLHDGAQQRLVALGMSLGLAREKLPHDPVAGAALVAEAHAEAKLALSELRDLARGISPVILADRGLDAALSALVRRAQIPVSIVVILPQRPPTTVESAAYFVVSEALTNISRHAQASRATITITSAGDRILVEVTDDGVGGADVTAGTGLEGLTERVAALDGSLTVESPAGGPTTIRAELPCAS